MSIRSGGRTINVRIPFWLSEDEFSKIVEELVNKLEGKISIGELRKILGIRENELTDEIEVDDFDFNKLRRKEMQRL